MCDCKSYNRGYGHVDGVVLPAPKGWFEYSSGGEKASVTIDACISGVIKNLWSSGLRTESSCCGHGTCAPSIVSPTDAKDDDRSAVTFWLPND